MALIAWVSLLRPRCFFFDEKPLGEVENGQQKSDWRGVSLHRRVYLFFWEKPKMGMLCARPPGGCAKTSASDEGTPQSRASRRRRLHARPRRPRANTAFDPRTWPIQNRRRPSAPSSSRRPPLAHLFPRPTSRRRPPCGTRCPVAHQPATPRSRLLANDRSHVSAMTLPSALSSRTCSSPRRRCDTCSMRRASTGSAAP